MRWECERKNLRCGIKYGSEVTTFFAVGSTETDRDANFVSVIFKIIYHVSHPMMIMMVMTVMVMITTMIKLLVKNLPFWNSAM
jgi:hypothetical protein